VTVKRLHSNLATEPFINRRVPVAVAASLIGLALLATVVSVALFGLRGGEYRSQRKTLEEQRLKLDKINRELSEEKRLLQGPAVATYASEGGFMAQVLDHKRFDWIALLDRVEAIKPYGARFTDVSPQRDEKTGWTIRLKGEANNRDEILKLEANLFASPFFQEPRLLREGRQTNSQTLQFEVSAAYLPEAKP
jgi:Tfp pilus assembly protein PilN